MMLSVIIVLLQICSVKAVQVSASPSCLEGFPNSINVTCTVTNALLGNIKWSKDNSLMTTCSSTTSDDCLDSPGFSEVRYTFTSDVGQKLFYLQIAPVTSSDIASFKCEHGTGDVDAFELANCPECVVPTVQNGQKNTTLGSVSAGTVVRVTCDSGYVISGSGILTCKADQTWDNQLPTCKTPPTTPRPCRLYICYIGVYLAVLSAVVFLVVYFIVRCPFNNLCGADFLQKIVLSSCCCMVICIIIGVAICIPEEPDCDAGVGIAVPIVIVIILHPCVTVGVIACHIKCCMDVEASDEDGDKQNEITKDENLTTNQKNGDPTDRHKKVQASHL